MSTCYRELKDFEKAIQLLEKALQLLKTKYSEENVLIATVYNNMGLVYIRWKKIEKSIEYY